jgi:hypothetical protein
MDEGQTIGWRESPIILSSRQIALTQAGIFGAYFNNEENSNISRKLFNS